MTEKIVSIVYGNVFFKKPKRFKKLVERKKYQNILLFTGKASYEASGSKEFIESSLGKISYTRVYDFDANPKAENLARIMEQINIEDFDCIVAIGGGSVIDFAKLVNFFASKKIDPAAYVEDRDGVYNDAEILDFIAIPTTAGAGSEGTKYSIIQMGDKKHTITEEEILPDYIFLIPELTESLSSYQTACVGADAMSQAIESLWAESATKESIGFAQKALNLIVPNIVNAVNNPTIIQRENMILGSYYAGKAVNISKTTGPHALSYYFTTKYDLPHGHAVSLTLTKFLELNWENISDNIKNIFFEAFHVKNYDELRFELSSIIAKIGIGFFPRIEDYDQMMVELKDNIPEDRYDNNPGDVDIDDVIDEEEI